MKRILIVDDDRQAGDALQEILAAQGWEAETAQTPEQATKRFDRESFDLVISDINLEASQSGLDWLKEFRQHCPVILLTGFGRLDTVVKATQEGAWDLISKPFKVREVIEAVPPELQSLEVRKAAERSPLAALFDDLPTLDELERRYLLHVLKAVGGNKTTTASVRGVDHRTLYRMANRFGIKLTEGDTETEPE